MNQTEIDAIVSRIPITQPRCQTVEQLTASLPDGLKRDEIPKPVLRVLIASYIRSCKQHIQRGKNEKSEYIRDFHRWGHRELYNCAILLAAWNKQALVVNHRDWNSFELKDAQPVIEIKHRSQESYEKLRTEVMAAGLSISQGYANDTTPIDTMHYYINVHGQFMPRAEHATLVRRDYSVFLTGGDCRAMRAFNVDLPPEPRRVRCADCDTVLDKELSIVYEPGLDAKRYCSVDCATLHTGIKVAELAERVAEFTMTQKGV